MHGKSVRILILLPVLLSEHCGKILVIIVCFL